MWAYKHANACIKLKAPACTAVVHWLYKIWTAVSGLKGWAIVDHTGVTVLVAKISLILYNFMIKVTLRLT